MKQLGESAIKFLIAFHAFEVQKSQSIGQALSIYKFVKNIRWPIYPTKFMIGVIGSDNAYEELNNTLKSKNVEDRSFIVKHINSTKEIKDCQVVYLSSEKSTELNSVMAEIRNKNVLVVTENDLVDKGAAISFLMVDDNLRFKVNESSLTENGLEASTILLNLSIK